MEFITLLFIGLVIYIVHCLSESKRKRKVVEYDRLDRVWKAYIRAVEGGHFLYPLSETSKQWIQTWKNMEYYSAKNSMPEEVKKSLSLYDLEH